MKVKVFYWKEDHEERLLDWRFGDCLPDLGDVMDDYAKVYDQETERDYVCSPEQIFALFTGSLPRWNRHNGAYEKSPNPLANPDGQAKLKSLDVGHTSMSVGDIVMIKEEQRTMVYVCESVGFHEIKWQ